MSVAPRPWRKLYQTLNPLEPAQGELYVEPPRSAAKEVAELIELDPRARAKFLLIGSRGGGKSTELRAIQRRLRSSTVSFRIDISAPESVSAFDLLYLQALTVLGVLERLAPGRGREMFEPLAKAYADSADARASMGSLDDSLQGLAAFTEASAEVAAAVGLTVGMAPVVSAALGAASVAVKLVRTAKSIISDTAPEGRDLQAAARAAMTALREHLHGHEPLLVIDGLERMNGQAPERLRDMFERTQLLWHADWSAVYAAPPCAITETNSAHAVGYKIVPVYGFAGQWTELENLVRQRLEPIVSKSDVGEGVVERIARSSGGVPRHAIEILKGAAREAHSRSVAQLSLSEVEFGERALAETLFLGLSSLDYDILGKVASSGQLPKSEDGDVRASALFGDGRILVSAPSAPSPSPRFLVHPLIEPHLPSRG